MVRTRVDAAYEQGRAARTNGRSKASNPHRLRDDPALFVAWRDGFEQKDEEIKEFITDDN